MNNAAAMSSDWESAFRFVTAGDASAAIDANALVAMYAKLGVAISAEEAQQMIRAFCGEDTCTAEKFAERAEQLHQQCAADVLVDSFAVLTGGDAEQHIEERTVDAARLTQMLGLFDSITDEEAQDMISG